MLGFVFSFFGRGGFFVLWVVFVREITCFFSSFFFFFRGFVVSCFRFFPSGTSQPPCQPRSSEGLGAHRHGGALWADLGGAHHAPRVEDVGLMLPPI